MKSFRTVVTPQKAGYTISHRDRLVSIGSCFSEHVGKRFEDYRFQININPFGQQYNAHSISQALERLMNPKPFESEDLVFGNEVYHSFYHHGSFSKPGKEETLSAINERLRKASEDLKKATILFLTLGTAHVFRLKETGQIVSNCHKLPGNLFTRELMTPAEIKAVLQQVIQKLSHFNPDVKIILTVSPVRYFAFGAQENTISKSHIFTALKALQSDHPELYYFPAYELVMDDLRDYRFFADDMLHPNQQAITYVWESLRDTLLDVQTRSSLSKIDEVIQAGNHRPRNPESAAHQKFLVLVEAKKTALKKELGIEF